MASSVERRRRLMGEDPRKPLPQGEVDRSSEHIPTAGHLGHHFVDLAQQHETNTLGMWVFLGTEIMFFGGLFLGFAAYHFLYPAAFSAASQHMNVLIGAINTAVLLTSSLLMALAVNNAEEDRGRKAIARLLALTVLLGLVFLILKGVEYVEHINSHELPGPSFVWEGADASRAELFFVFYWFMTGLHALHVIIGMAIISIIAYRAWRGHFAGGYSTPVELVGLYWHFVDLVWVFLFPLLYLIGRH